MFTNFAGAFVFKLLFFHENLNLFSSDLFFKILIESNEL